MKVYESIEQLAEEMEVSERTAWRWLKQGRIKKKRSEDGRIIFVLVDEPTDITDIDDSDNVTTDVSSMSVNDTESILDVSGRRGRKLSVRPVSGLVQSMRDELETSKVEFEIEKIEDARSKWQERKDRERKEKAEQERAERLEEHWVREGERQTEEKEIQKRNVIQKVKNHVIPAGMRAFIPAHILAFMYQEIEKVLSRMDVLGLPFSELVVLAKSIRDRVIEQNSESVRQSVYEYLMALSRNGLKECLKQMYNDYMMDGGELSYRGWILTNTPPENQRQLLELINL